MFNNKQGTSSLGDDVQKLGRQEGNILLDNLLDHNQHETLLSRIRHRFHQ